MLICENFVNSVGEFFVKAQFLDTFLMWNYDFSKLFLVNHKMSVFENFLKSLFCCWSVISQFVHWEISIQQFINLLSTVWIFETFSAIKILREIDLDCGAMILQVHGVASMPLRFYVKLILRPFNAKTATFWAKIDFT